MVICLSRFVIGSLPAVNNSSLQALLGSFNFSCKLSCADGFFHTVVISKPPVMTHLGKISMCTDMKIASMYYKTNI